MDESEGPTCTDLVAGHSFSSIKVIVFHMMIDPLRGFEAKPVKLERGGVSNARDVSGGVTAVWPQASVLWLKS